MFVRQISKHRTFFPESDECVSALNQECFFLFTASNMAQDFPKGAELCKHKVKVSKIRSEMETQFYQTTNLQQTLTNWHQVAWNIAVVGEKASEMYENVSFIHSVSDLQLSQHYAEEIQSYFGIAYICQYLNSLCKKKNSITERAANALLLLQ